VGSLLVLGPVAPAVAAVGACADIGDASTVSDPDKAASAPMTALGIAQFQQAIRARGVEPGAGVGVAVVDSGVLPTPPGLQAVALPVSGKANKTTTYYHGTAVAGLIAGAGLSAGKPIGVAPAATIVDQHFYDVDAGTSDPSLGTDQGAPLDSTTLAVALEKVARFNTHHQVRVVNVSAATSSSPRLQAAVTSLTRQGVIVVASSGNRPQAGSFPSDFATPRFGEDAAQAVFPAGYAETDPLVVAVGSTYDASSGDASPVLPNSAIDVVAPTAGAVSYGLNHQTCALGDTPATSWSAAEVSGILAALISVFGDETPRQIVSRLEATATGAEPGRDQPADRTYGQGVVQPLEALTRDLRFDPQGRVVSSSSPRQVVEPAPLPQPAPDVLASTRRHALWWGLGGGGALLVAVTLRPVLSRRRR
jgi:membrane-anchored mycosin MYCP